MFPVSRRERWPSASERPQSARNLACGLVAGNIARRMDTPTSGKSTVRGRRSPPVNDPDQVREMFGAIAHRYDLANHLLSGGLDVLWRRRTARIIRARNPARILDLATGSGDLARALRRHCPAATVVAADFAEPMLARARAKGLTDLVVADARSLPFADRTFDAVTVAFGLRNMQPRDCVLREIHRVLRPGGVLAVLDFSLPPRPWRQLYGFYLHRVLPVVAGWVTGNPDAYRYLGASIESFPAGPAMLAELGQAGFADAIATAFTGGIVTLYTARRPRDEHLPVCSRVQ